MSDESVRRRAAAEVAFTRRVARMIVERQETVAIIEEWDRFAGSTRAEGREVTKGELVSTLVGIVDESRRMVVAELVEAADKLCEALNAVKRALDDPALGLEAQDALGSFELQGLMNDYNQAEELAAKMLKSREDTVQAVIDKIR